MSEREICDMCGSEILGEFSVYCADCEHDRVEVFDAVMAWLDADMKSKSNADFMLVAVSRHQWPAFLGVVEGVWKKREERKCRKT